MMIQNYRPIAILSAPAKIFELIIYKRIFYQVKNAISIHQHGFMPKRSTTTNLINFTQYISEALENRTQVDVLYTDFSKAFDCIDHKLLIIKLKTLGFHESLIKFISSYLENRTMFVSCNNFISPVFKASSGVPQGSNLGPLLFLLFVNDICNRIKHCKFLLYADDLKLYQVIENRSDCLLLQADIDSIVDWSLANKLNFNINKCKIMTYNKTKHPIAFDYVMHKTTLDKITFTRDLGIQFDTHLTFNKHISKIASDSLKVLGFIYRNVKHFSTTKPLDTLYYSYVVSKLDYCSAVWSPFYLKYQLIIERVQFKYLKLKYFMEQKVFPTHISYIDLLNMYNVYPLKKRRDLFGQMHLYKLLHNSIDDPQFLSSVKIKVPDSSIRVRRNFTFLTKIPKTNLYKMSPLYNICSIHNSLCSNVDIFGLDHKYFKSLIWQCLLENK